MFLWGGVTETKNMFHFRHVGNINSQVNLKTQYKLQSEVKNMLLFSSDRGPVAFQQE